MEKESFVQKYTESFLTYQSLSRMLGTRYLCQRQKHSKRNLHMQMLCPSEWLVCIQIFVPVDRLQYLKKA